MGGINVYIFREILALGFDEKFIRTWEYYFDYCAAGFKTCTLGNYQVYIFICFFTK
jgi:cyclopropane fatty-acyl-phospholipid synthase-like methyltransferase